jgi:hypothetical protein
MQLESTKKSPAAFAASRFFTDAMPPIWVRGGWHPMPERIHGPYAHVHETDRHFHQSNHLRQRDEMDGLPHPVTGSAM